MSSTIYPEYVNDILDALETSEDLENLLIQKVDLINSDIILYNIYLDLGYQSLSESFSKPLQSEQIKDLIQKSYSFTHLAPETNIKGEENNEDEVFFDINSLNTHWTDPEPHRFNFGTVQVKSRQTRQTQTGLRSLSLRVRDMVQQKMVTTFKEVSDELVEEVWDAEGEEATKENKNIRRRVYDALNVLISSGVIKKSGRQVEWGNQIQSASRQELQKELDQIKTKRDFVEEKRNELNQVSDKYVCLRGLIDRNKTKIPEEIVQFPYILLATPDETSNSMSIRLNAANTRVWSSFKKPVKIVGDIESILGFRLNRNYNLLPEDVQRLINKNP